MPYVIRNESNLRFRDPSEQGLFKINSRAKINVEKSKVFFVSLFYSTPPYPALMHKNFCTKQRPHNVARVRLGLIDQWTYLPLYTIL